MKTQELLETSEIDAVAGGNATSHQNGVTIGAALIHPLINATTDAMCAVHNFFTGDEL